MPKVQEVLQAVKQVPRATIFLIVGKRFTTPQDYFAIGEDTHTCRLQASLTRRRGVCEADS